MDIEIKISAEYKNPKVLILADKVTEEINRLVAKLSEEETEYICVFNESTMQLLEQNEIVRVYSIQGKVIAETDTAEYSMRNRLYEMEEKLNISDFVRISNSEIINLKKVRSFDLSLTGTIHITFKNGMTTYASRRFVSKIKKKLGV